jgi:D-aminopeptidase
MNVPVLMAAGGNRFINYVKKYNESIATIITKEEIGKFSAKMVNMNELKNRIDKTISSMHSVDKYPVITISSPIKCEIELKNTKYAEVASLIPNVKRLSGRKIIYKSDTMRSIYEILMAIIFCCRGLPVS